MGINIEREDFYSAEKICNKIIDCSFSPQCILSEAVCCIRGAKEDCPIYCFREKIVNKSPAFWKTYKDTAMKIFKEINSDMGTKNALHGLEAFTYLTILIISVLYYANKGEGKEPEIPSIPKEDIASNSSLDEEKQRTIKELRNANKDIVEEVSCYIKSLLPETTLLPVQFLSVIEDKIYYIVTIFYKAAKRSQDKIGSKYDDNLEADVASFLKEQKNKKSSG